MRAVSNPAGVTRAVSDARVDAALLSRTPSVCQATGYTPPWEMWPGYNPHIPEPILACAWPDQVPQLLLPDWYAAYRDEISGEVQVFPTYSYEEDVDQVARAADAVAAAIGPQIDRLGWEPRTTPAELRARIDERVRVGEWVDVTATLQTSRLVKTPEEIEALRTACAVADDIQSGVKELAQPGEREIDVAAELVARAWRRIGARYAVLLTLRAGKATAELDSGEPGSGRVGEGDLVCADTAPWVDGVWGDSCNAVVAGSPTQEMRRMFDAAAFALEAGLAAVRPGVTAGDVDAACRNAMSERGYEYGHHTGHGIGYAHTEPPRVGPGSVQVLEAGMVLCLEPGAYVPGVGGFRHEHQFVVREDGVELLTHFEHVL